MMHKLSCSLHKQARAGSWISLLAVALCFVGFARPGQAGDTAPDWLRAAARETVPVFPNNPVAVILLDECSTTVRDNGEIETVYRRAYKILRPEGRERYGHLEVHFDSDTRLLELKAWAIPADGKEYELKEKDSVEHGLVGEGLYNDERVKVLDIPAATPGNVIGYEYSKRHRPYLLEDDWYFQDLIPILRARFTLQLPPGWEITTRWANYVESKEQPVGSNSFLWEVENIPAVEVEPEMPPWPAVAGHMDVKYSPRDPALRSKTSGSWNDIALWYAGLTVSSREASPEIKQKVAELTAGEPTTLDKIKALTSFMQRQIRYVAIEIGIGGYQPHPASEVFRYRYGDCKDKATLLGSMLHEIGVESYYVVAQTDRGILRPDFPSLRGFNHMILAIRLPDDVPSAGLYAILKHPQYGRLLIFDPTDPYTPLGYIPPYEQDNYGLLVTPTGGELLALPLLPASTNRLLRTGELTLTSNGDLTGDVVEIRWGAPAVIRRAQILETPPADRAKIFEDFLGYHLNNFRLTSASIGNLELYDQTLELHYKFVVQNYAKVAGNLLLVRPRVLGSEGGMVDADKPRKYPIQFLDATVQSDDYKIALPAGFVADDLPDPVDVKTDYGSYKSKIDVADGSLHYRRTFEIKQVYIATPEVPDLRKFYSQISSDERANAVLRKSAP